jgi:DNA-binding NtrC family response regulator
MSVAKVCVIEDDSATRETLCFLLAEAGYEVIEAANGSDGRALLEASESPMVVLLDFWLPGVSGGDILNHWVNDGALRKRHSFILMSASTQAIVEACGEAISAMSVRVIAKPFDLDDLTEAVRRAEQELQTTG